MNYEIGISQMGCETVGRLNFNSISELIDKMKNVNNNNPDYLLELVNYQYGYVAWCIGNNKNDEAKKYLDQAEKNIAHYAGTP